MAAWGEGEQDWGRADKQIDCGELADASRKGARVPRNGVRRWRGRWDGDGGILARGVLRPPVLIPEFEGTPDHSPPGAPTNYFSPSRSFC